MKLEGIVSKRADAPYRSGRTKAWLKIKCGIGQEFIVIGWRPSDVKARPFSSLLLAVREGDRLTYRGRVGSGFGERELDELWPELQKRAVKTPPADDVPRRHPPATRISSSRSSSPRSPSAAGPTTAIVRQGSYKGLRKDKKAAGVVAEIPRSRRRSPRRRRAGARPQPAR